MKIIKLENQKCDCFYEAECFLHIGEAEEDKNYVTFDLVMEDDPLYSCSYYDFEKETGSRIFHCFDGQDYSWKCPENTVTNDKELIDKIESDFSSGNYDILRNSTIKYLREIVYKNKVNFSEKLIEILEKIKTGERINKKEFRIELKKIGLCSCTWKGGTKKVTKVFDDVVAREIGFEKIVKWIRENNINKIIFENSEFLEKEEIENFVKKYSIIEFRNFKPIKDFDMIKMTLEEWNNLEKWNKLEDFNNIIEIEEKDFEKDAPIYRLNGKKINAKIEITDLVEKTFQNGVFDYLKKILSRKENSNLKETTIIKGVIRDGRKFYSWVYYDKNDKIFKRKEYDEFGQRCDNF